MVAHRLIARTYPARTLAYCFCALLVAVSNATSIPTLLLVVMLISYPHLLLRLQRAVANSATGARLAMLIDSVLAGFIVAVSGLDLWVLAAVIGALLMSTRFVADHRWLAGATLVFLLTLALFVRLFTIAIPPAPALTTLIAILMVVGYGTFVAMLSFVETSMLAEERGHALRRSLISEKLNDLMRPFLNHRVLDCPVSERRSLTIFFSDLQGFTHWMDSESEMRVTELLNEYLDAMAAIALRHGGTVDKFMGDGMLVLFGAPGSEGLRNDAIQCARMALAMKTLMVSLRHRWQAPLHVRMGIHSGFCTVGNFGSSARMDYTAVGGNVNIASRLEGVAGRDEIIISDATWKLLDGSFEIRPIGAVSLKGIRDPVSAAILLREVKLQKAEFRLLGHGL